MVNHFYRFFIVVAREDEGVRLLVLLVEDELALAHELVSEPGKSCLGRGPRYQAQQGPILLARKTGAAVFCFHISMKHRIQLKSWDEFQIPLPFTKAIVLKAAPIWVSPDASEAHLRDLHRQMQATLDELRIKGDSWW